MIIEGFLYSDSNFLFAFNSGFSAHRSRKYYLVIIAVIELFESNREYSISELLIGNLLLHDKILFDRLKI